MATQKIKRKDVRKLIQGRGYRNKHDKKCKNRTKISTIISDFDLDSQNEN